MGDASRRWARVVGPAVIALSIAIPIQQASAATAPRNTSLPVLSGTPTVGSTMTTTAGSWTGSPTPTYTYQWQRCKVGGSCSNISGATNTTYAVVGADVGKQLRSRVIGKNSAGSKTVYTAK